MKMLFCRLLVASLLIFATIGHASSSITMDAPTVVYSGETLTLSGRERFNQGQLRNLFFFVGVNLVEPLVIDQHTVRIVVPAVPPGIHTVRVVKHIAHPGRDLVVFSDQIEVVGERVIASVSGTISPGGGRLELAGVARVELGEDGSRAPVDFTIEHVISPEQTIPFQSYLASEDLPAVANRMLIRLLATERIPGFLGIRVRLPDDIRALLGSGLEPELYAEVPMISVNEDMGEYRPLHADYNAETGELSAPFSGTYFHDLADPAQPSRSATVSAAQPQFSGRILISVRTYGERRAPVTATVSFPNAPAIQAGARDTLNLQAQLEIGIPSPLRNPTNYGGVQSPEVTSGYSPGHGGLDLRSRDGDPVYAAAAGRVSKIWNNVLPGHPRCNPTAQRGGGWSIAIDHADGARTSYSHLIVGSEVVGEGQNVAAGQQLAQADHTGGTCPSGEAGAHLHFGYRIDGIGTNPLPFIQADPVVFEKQWLDQLSVIAIIDGLPIEATRRRVTAKTFQYTSPLDLNKLDLQPNRTYPISLRVLTKDGRSVDFFSGTLKINPSALRVVLTWDKAITDVDLHVLDSNGNEAWYRDRTGIPGGFLDHDDTDGFGPEVFTLDTLQPNTTYAVALHYYSDRGNGPTNARAVVYLNNLEVTNVVVPLVSGQFLSIGTY